MRLTVRVPATIANLGPGFDAFAMAVGLWNEVEADTDAGPRIAIEGEGLGELPEDGSNLVFRAMTFLSREVGRTLPPLALTCRNAIPLERGLGSSAAAVVGGLVLADRLLGSDLGPERVLAVAADLEGHADNAAAALHGGLALGFLDAGGWRVERLEPHPGLSPVLFVPDAERVATQEARRVLPREVPRDDAVFNASRAALLVLALTERPDLLPAALEDRLHQQARLRLAPSARALFADLKEAGVPVCVAGSGPSLLAFDGFGPSLPDLGPGWRVLRVRIERDGARLSEG